MPDSRPVLGGSARIYRWLGISAEPVISVTSAGRRPRRTGMSAERLPGRRTLGDVGGRFAGVRVIYRYHR